MLGTLSNIRKAIVTGLGMLVTILTLVYHIPFLPGPWHLAVAAVLGFATTFLTWLVPNAGTPVVPATQAAPARPVAPGHPAMTQAPDGSIHPTDPPPGGPVTRGAGPV